MRRNLKKNRQNLLKSTNRTSYRYFEDVILSGIRNGAIPIPKSTRKKVMNKKQKKKVLGFFDFFFGLVFRVYFYEK